MRNATKNFLIVLFLMFSFTVLSSTTLAFSEVRTVVTIISPPEINDLSIVLKNKLLHMDPRPASWDVGLFIILNVIFPSWEPRRC